jgi:hypothetical protein
MIVTNHSPTFDMTSCNLENGKIHILPNKQFHVKQLFTLDEVMFAFDCGATPAFFQTREEFKFDVIEHANRRSTPTNHVISTKPKPRYRIYLVDLGPCSPNNHPFEYVEVDPKTKNTAYRHFNPTTGLTTYFIKL